MFLIPESSYTIKTLKKKGRGVFAARDIEAGTVIGDYLGTIMNPKDEDEKKYGLYDMGAGEKYDILGDPKIKGVHFINHSCANNCDIYPYRGHILFFALRKIFKGEELSINYCLYGPDEVNTTCNMHACYCGSRFCRGTMHDSFWDFHEWETLVKKEFGVWYKKIPGKYGEQLKPLDRYPEFIHPEKRQKIYEYGVFAAESKPAATFHDKTLPTATELKKRIREAGRPLSFPKLHVIVYAIHNGILLAEGEK